jgi:hypothetical protein
VRVEESACPFCRESLALESLPPRARPRARLGRAATFAFGASVVGATALVACSDGATEADVGIPVYGAPAAGTSGEVPGPGGGGGGQGGAPLAEGGQSGAAPVDSGEAGGEAFAVYGGPPGGEGSL